MNLKTRKEERYIINKTKTQDFVKKISQITSPEIFPTNYNHTLYFNNVEHEVPFEVSIKGRRYGYEGFTGSFEPEEKWIFEIKEDFISKNSRLRRKQRENLTLEEILKKLSGGKLLGGYHITSPLGVYGADSYRRSHYKIKGKDNFRITIDDDITYYLFEERFNGNEVGREDYSRVEIKILPHEPGSPEVYLIHNILEELGAEPTVSKKDMLYNLITDYLRRKTQCYVKPSNIEIEAKMLLGRENQHVFHQIKKDFYSGFINGFVIPENFPYTLEGGKLHRYVITPNGGYVRISIKGKSKKVVSKEGSGIVADPLGLNCIIKRREIKESLSGNLLALPSKTLHRKRKYFIVENEKSKNQYCILIDRCTYDDDELYQMEVEGLLLSPSRDEEKELVRDVAYLTNQLIKKYPVLKPTTLTKLEWLKNM